MSDIFLWPRPRPLLARHWLGGAINCADIEAQLKALYPAAEPVLFSSARAGLRATLVHLGLSRPDLVWVPPFSSHCVFDAVSRIATPTTQATETPAAALIYHQWGHVCRHSFAAGTTIIEDAVDTLFAPGATPFAVGGRFALWSLPKVVASHWGGVVFCTQVSDAQALRSMRDALPSGTLQACLRLGEHLPRVAAYWHGSEAGQGRLPSFALHHIAEALSDLPAEVDARRQRLSRLQVASSAPHPAADRLPSNIPVPAIASLAGTLPSGDQLTAGIRSFNIDRCAPNARWQRVFPIPIHQDICGTDIAEIEARLASAPDFSTDEPDII